MSRRRDDHRSSRSSRRRRSRTRSRSRSPVVSRKTFSTTLEGSLGPSSATLPGASNLPPTSLMGSLLASAQAKAAEEAASKAKALAKSGLSATGGANGSTSLAQTGQANATGFSVLEGALIVDETLDKEAEQRRLDIEMQKRRERIDRWRKERKLKHDILSVQQKTMEPPRHPRSAKWNLDDDDDEEDVSKKIPENKREPDDEIDPLDAFMQTLTDDPKPPTVDTKEIKPKPRSNAGAKPKRGKPPAGKGELMETNIDEMEYSSEEEEPTLEDALAQLQRKDKVIAVDHSKIDYKPFKKNFYVEVPELIKMSAEDVKAYRQSLENIRVRGVDCPKPLKNWVQAGVSSRLLCCLKRNKFDKPTPIQCQALPVIMSGRDMIGIAKTGSGKTLAFLVPLIRHLEHQAPLEPGEGPIALLLSPTRELALQIFKEARKLCQSVDARVVCVYGGTGISEQIAELKRGAEIVVCTPGRMIDMLAANGGRVTNLRRCTYVVLDEADRMFDLGFEPQVMRIVENCRPDRQTLMFSATFPRQMELLARKALTNPIEIQVGGRSVVCSDVEQHALILTEDEKFYKVLELLGVYQETGSILIFVEKQESADELMRVLLKYGYPCLSLHGGIDQYDRDSVITDFKRGNIRLLVATSVAARGLDVNDLMVVINYDCPNHYEDYVHRCGRTGRAGNKGFAYTFLTPDQERNAGDLVRAFKQSGQKPPEDLMAMWNAYKSRMAAEGKKVFGSSGFRGKGFMFDEAEALLNCEKRKAQKAALGLQDSDEDEPDQSGADWETKIEGMMTTRRIGEVAGVASAASAANNQATINAALALARQKAAQLGISKNLGISTPAGRGDVAQATAKAVLSGNLPSASVGPASAGVLASAAAAGTPSSRTLAEQAAERLNAKLGYSKNTAGAEEEGSGQAGSDMVKRFEEELVINDFPQSVRWRITGREMLNHLNDFCDVGVSVRGIYMPPAKAKNHVPQGNDDRPLYLCIEAVSEREIALAKKEIMRVIKEEMVKLQSGSATKTGRYKVL